ncbi:MAG: PAS domain-containing protein, partial [Planctomycetaceae bacterium]
MSESPKSLVLDDQAAPAFEPAGILEQLPDGVVLLDAELRILWCNGRFNELTGRDDALVGQSFYSAFGTPEILGPDFCPFHTALGSGESSKSTLRVGEKQYFEVHARSTGDEVPGASGALIVMVRDVSVEILQRQKLNAIYQAG